MDEEILHQGRGGSVSIEVKMAIYWVFAAEL
jgi:hypothetical protein